jgi:SAM-dependent methyltransferase
MTTSPDETAQREHYNRIATAYEAHYDDPWSQRFRQRFIAAPLLAGLDLGGKEVLDAMCGYGPTTGALLARGARVTGLDISEEILASFRRRWPQCRTVCASIMDSGLPSESFEAVVIVGGLHHLHPDVERALGEIHRLLRPGGVLCFLEPHAGSLPDLFRRQWYKRDPTFAPNEAAVDLERLKRRFAADFVPIRERHGGNIAFLLVFNSMIFRVPLWLKKFYSGACLALEGPIGRLQGRRLGCFVIGQWRKK